MKLRLTLLLLTVFTHTFPLAANPDDEEMKAELTLKLKAIEEIHQDLMRQLRATPSVSAITSPLHPIMNAIDQNPTDEIAEILSDYYKENHETIMNDPTEFDNFLTRLMNSLDAFTAEIQNDIKLIAKEIKERDELMKQLQLTQILRANTRLLLLLYIEDLAANRDLVTKRLAFCKNLWSTLRDQFSSQPTHSIHEVFDPLYVTMIFDISYYQGTLKKETLGKIIAANDKLYKALNALT